MKIEKWDFDPAPWIPFRDKKVLEFCRNATEADLINHKPNPDYTVKIVQDCTSLFVADVFARIKMSDDNDTPLTMIFPNPWPSAYVNIAEMCNRYNVSYRNVHAFAMDEWADQDGNIAPITYQAGLGYAFKKYFYGSIREDLRPPEENIHVISNETVDHYSDMIDECGDGGADVCYSAVGWPGHIAFVDPDSEFAADHMDDYLKLKARRVTQHPLTIAENSMFGIFGCSGDVANVPPRAATIGPYDVAHARDHFEMHSLTALGGYNSWQRMISRMAILGPVTMQVPASILQLFKTTIYVSEDIARPFGCWETVGY